MLAVSTCDLDLLLPVANTFAAFTQLVVLAAALELRRSLPYMPRPAKGACVIAKCHYPSAVANFTASFHMTSVPGGIPLMLLLSLLPTLIMGYLIVRTFMETKTAIICGTLLVVGAAIGITRAFRSRHRYF